MSYCVCVCVCVAGVEIPLQKTRILAFFLYQVTRWVETDPLCPSVNELRITLTKPWGQKQALQAYSFHILNNFPSHLAKFQKELDMLLLKNYRTKSLLASYPRDTLSCIIPQYD